MYQRPSRLGIGAHRLMMVVGQADADDRLISMVIEIGVLLALAWMARSSAYSSSGLAAASSSIPVTRSRNQA